LLEKISKKETLCSSISVKCSALTPKKVFAGSMSTLAQLAPT